MVQILPGIDESIGPRIRALGQAIYARTGLARRRMIEEAILKNPSVVQEFADLEFKSPGSLERLGLGDLGEMLKGVAPSRELEVEKATREFAIPTEVNKAKGEKAQSELDVQAYEDIPGLLENNPRLREDFARGKIKLDDVLTESKKLREERVAQKEEPNIIRDLEEQAKKIDPNIVSIVDDALAGKEIGSKMESIIRDPAKYKLFQDLLSNKRQLLEDQNRPENRLVIMDTLSGAARKIFQDQGVTNPEEITNLVSAQYPDVDTNLVRQAVNRGIAAQTEAQGRNRATAPLFFEGIKTIKDLYAKAKAEGKAGPAAGILERLAQLDAKSGAITAGGLAAALSGGASGIGKLAAYLGLGAASTPLLRGLARELQSEDSQLFWTAALNVTAAQYRKESGAAVRLDEIRNTIERMIPLGTDKPAIVDLKLRQLESLRRIVKIDSGLPDQTEFVKEPPPISTAPQTQQGGDTLPPRPSTIQEITKESRDAANFLLDQFKGQDRPAIRAANKLQMDSANIFLQGRMPRESFPETLKVLKEIAEIDNQLDHLQRMKVPALKSVIEELKNKRKSILSSEVGTNKNALTDTQYINFLNNKIIEWGNKIPNASGKELEDLEKMIAVTQQEIERVKAKEGANF